MDVLCFQKETITVKICKDKKYKDKKCEYVKKKENIIFIYAVEK